MSESFAWLQVKHWYQALMAVGAAGAAGALAFELKGVANAHVLLLSLGMFFMGLGEWINHPLQTAIIPPNAYLGGGGVVSGHPRSANLTGTLFDLLGFVLGAIGLYKIIAAA